MSVSFENINLIISKQLKKKFQIKIVDYDLFVSLLHKLNISLKIVGW